MKIPISNQLKKRTQLDIAILQDELIEIVYSVTDDFVLHGSTAIWRCYGGKRFSQDIDGYSISFTELKSAFEKEIKERRLVLDKFKDTRNVIFASVSDGRTVVQLEVNHSVHVKGVQIGFELMDGTEIDVLSLTPEQLILEKISAYSDRHYIRDLFDIYHLLHCELDLSAVRGQLDKLLMNIPASEDESVLRSIVYAGLAPSFNRMVEEIRRLLRRSS